VLFIGYSLNDPVMRYLMDIFATESAEDQRGQFRRAYSFVAHGDDDAGHQQQLWEAKHVTPILYHHADRHQTLITTLENWAHVHRAASDGRFQVLMEAVNRPFQGDIDADNLANAAWALSDKGHKTARRLGSLDSEVTNSDANITWFGPLLGATIIHPLDNRRSPKTCQLADVDEVVLQMCRWAMRHLENRDLVKWAISNEQLLLTRLRRPFFHSLVIKLHVKNKIVSEPFRLFWQLLIDAAADLNELRDLDIFWRMALGGKTPTDELSSIVGRLQPRLRWPDHPFGRRAVTSVKMVEIRSWSEVAMDHAALGGSSRVSVSRAGPASSAMASTCM
jgi:hypothetical protein